MFNIEIKTILKIEYQGHNLPTQVFDILHKIVQVFKDIYTLNFTFREYLSDDSSLASTYYSSEKMTVYLRSSQDYQRYIIAIKFDDIQEENNIKNIIQTYIGKYAFTTEELIEQAIYDLKNNLYTWSVDILSTASFQGTQPIDKRIVSVLQKALYHDEYSEIRAGACWSCYTNRDYWCMMLPMLKKLSLIDLVEDVRIQAHNSENCMKETLLSENTLKTEEMMEKAIKDLQNNSYIGLQYLMICCFLYEDNLFEYDSTLFKYDKQAMNENIINILTLGLTHENPEIREKTCWCIFMNDIYKITMLPTLKELAKNDIIEDVRNNVNLIISYIQRN